MSDRNARNHDPDVDPAAREPEATLDDLREGALETPAVSPEPMPDTPNDDLGFDAAPPDDVDMQRTSDDNDLNPTGGGFTDTPLRTEYESMARRDDLARRLEDLVADAREWAREDESEAAHDIAEMLAAAYERLGVPTEDTDNEPDVPQAEPGNMERPGRP